MKIKGLITILLICELIASVAQVGCGKKNQDLGTKTIDTKPGIDTENTVKMDKFQFLNGTLNFEPKSLDPTLATDADALGVLVNCMEGLTRIEQGEDGKDVIKAAGAERWEVSEDKTVWTFYLRDYEWSDGKAVTAKDFEFAIKRTLNPEVGSKYAFILYPLKNAEAYNYRKANAEDVGVKAIDAKTLQFTLDKPTTFFLDLTYFKVMYPQREDIVKAQGDKFGKEANTMVFCGPFVLKNWIHQNKMEFEKNPTYWDKDSVKLEKLTLNIIKEESGRMSSLFNGVIDYALVTKQESIEKLNATGKFNVTKANTPGINFMFFNQNNKYFSNAKIRQAFSLAVDREERVETLNRELAEPAYGYCPPRIEIDGEDFRAKVGVEPLRRFKEENLDAKALLIEGLKEIGASPDPAENTFTYLQPGTDAITRKNGKYDEEMYQENLGVSIKMEYVEWTEFLKRTNEMDYQIAAMPWIGDYNDPNTFFYIWMTGANMVPTGWSNAKYDDLIDQADSTTDVKKRIEMFNQAEQILVVDETVIAPLAYRMKNIYIYKYLNRVIIPLFGAQDFKYAYTNGRK